MSFLDSLENNLKALESREEADPEKRARDLAARAAEQAEAALTAPVAEALRNSPFTAQLLTACRVIGHRTRTFVRPTWIDAVLRLEARTRKLELRPTAQGVRAVYFEDGAEVRTAPVDLDGDAEALIRGWLEGPGA